MGKQGQAEYLCERLPEAQLLSIDGSAPVLWIEDPDPLVTAIERFLGSVKTEEEEFDRVLALAAVRAPIETAMPPGFPFDHLDFSGVKPRADCETCLVAWAQRTARAGPSKEA